MGKSDTCLELSPTGRSMVPRGENAGLMDLMLSPRKSPFSPRHVAACSELRPGHPNYVDLNRIQSGLDVRTTVRVPTLVTFSLKHITEKHDADHAAQHSEQDRPSKLSHKPRSLRDSNK
jgi:hypothetical protein